MAQNTEHYNLVKPDYADAADVSQINGNMDIIDGILWQLANAGADEELLKKVQEILDKIGETDDTGGSYVSGSVMSKLNESLKETESIGGNVDMLIRLLSYGVFEEATPGAFSTTLPEGVTKIKVTACGAGGSGAGWKSEDRYMYSDGPAGGGGGGAAIVEKEFEVESGATITGNIGTGGAETSVGNGKPGESTVIDGLITLAGGLGGTTKHMSTSGLGDASSAGGEGGGSGGAGYIIQSGVENQKSKDGNPGALGKGGLGANTGTTTQFSRTAGGGGGGSIGDGGNGAGQTLPSASPTIDKQATAGTRGGGGGGGGGTSSNHSNGAKGGDGYIKIVWGY